ncbi:TolC family protein, partial [Staphylococcus aureus]
NNQPAQKAAILRVKSAEESVKRAKTAFYPTLSAFGGLGSNFANPSSSVTGFTVVGSKPTGSFVTVGGSNYLVYQPDVQFTTAKKSFFDQWNGWGPQLDQN